MKFPVALESTRVVVLMICFPTSSLTGNCKVLSLAEATNIW